MNLHLKNKLLLFVITLICIFLFEKAEAQPGTSWKEQDRQYLVEILSSSLDTFLQLTEHLSEERFFGIPKDNTWSVAQISEHLSQIEEGYQREYFVAINIPPTDPITKLKKVTDEAMLAYEESPQKSVARGTNLPLNRYKTKDESLRILKGARDETIRLMKEEKRDLRNVFTYRKKEGDIYEVKDIHQHFLILVAHMKRHTTQAKRALE